MGNINNLKHTELYNRYKKQPEPKAKYTIFFARTQNYGQSYEEAISPKSQKGRHLIKTHYDDYGRECTCCNQYKEWKEFARTKNGINRRTPDCLSCRREKKRIYREKTKRKKDKEYRDKIRSLNIGDKVSLLRVVYVNGLPMEDIYEVKKKEKMKAYLIQSIHTGSRERLDPVHGNTNYKPFYKVESD